MLHHFGDLVPLEDFLGTKQCSFDLVYADAAHPNNNFGQIYRRDARMLGLERFAEAIQIVADLCSERHGWTLVLHDCFRPIEAQRRMKLARPDLLDDLLAPPGVGGHPRGLAIDVAPYLEGRPVDMGTAFDDFSLSGQQRAGRRHSGDGSPAWNEVLRNRGALDQCFVDASAIKKIPIIGTESEWWDYRVPDSLSSVVAPISDKDLPIALRMMDSPAG